MALLLLSVVIIAFVMFFYGIGLWFLALIPLIFVGMFFGYYSATHTIKVNGPKVLQKYALYFARIIIMAGLLGVFNFFEMDLTYSGLGLLVLNLVFRIVSALSDYKDGKIIAQLGLYISVAFLLIVSLMIGGRILFFNIFAMLRIMYLGVVAFMIFLVGLYNGVEKYMRYKLSVLSLGTVFLVVFDQIQNTYIALSVNMLLLTGLYYLIFRIFQLTPVSDEKKKEISVRRILAGERITKIKKQFRSPLLERLHAFVEHMPGATKQILELFNIILIIILIVYYITHIGGFVGVSHLFYRVTIVAFVANVFLLKKVGYNSIIQNLVVFLVINFAIYVSLFSYFSGDIGSVASWGIIWNIRSAGMIFYAHRVSVIAKIFTKTDYIYRIVSCVVAMIVNVALLMYTQWSGELIFFIALVYVGLQSMIIYYASRYLGRIQNVNN